MRCRLFSIVFIAASFLLAPPRSLAQFADGDSVVSTENVELRDPDGGVIPLKAATLLVVNEVKGDSLLVQEGTDGEAGWIAAAKVVREDKALDYFTEKIKANPKNARAYEVRGDYYSWKMDLKLDLLGSQPVDDQARESTKFYWEEALADYDEAIKLGRRSAELFVNRASMKAMLSEEQEPVLADLTEAIEIDPDHARAYGLRGSLLAGFGDFEKAIPDLDRAANLDPKDPSTHCEIARIRGSCQDSQFLDGKKAMEHAEQMLATALVVTEDMHHVAAAAYARAGQFAKAIEHAEAGLAMTFDETHAEAQERLDLYKAGKAFQDPKVPTEQE